MLYWKGTAMLKYISSLKLAVFLIAAIAAISILATIFPAADAFNSWTFRLLVAAFFINLGTCTIKLLPGLYRQLKRSAADVPENATYAVYDADEAELTAWLQSQHYKAIRTEDGQQIKILASKGKAALCAPHVLHVSILVILIGAMVSMANTSGFVMGQVGQSRPFPEELQPYYGDAYVEILDFQTVYDDQNAVDNWVTKFNLYIDGMPVAENVETKVNEPYAYDNMMIYQNSYDYRHLIEVTGSADADNNSAYGIPDNMPLGVGNDTIVVADLNGSMYLQVSDHQSPARGQFVQPGDTLALTEEGAVVTYLGTIAYTVLEVKTRFGTPIVFFGFLLAVVSSMMFLCGRYREVWILAAKGQNTCRVHCHSKSAVVVEELEEALQEQWKIKTEER